MSKGKNSGATGATAAAATDKVRKSTKGIPRVTNKVIGMSEADRKAWLDKVPSEHRSEVEARLTEALKGGRKPSKIDFSTTFKGRTVEELMTAKTALDAELASAGEREEQEAQEQLNRIQAKIDAFKAAKAAKAQTESVPA
jgi:hypothetical protein